MVQQIAPQAAAELVQEGAALVIDVREFHEWAQGHIPGAQHAPLSRLRQSPKSFLQRDKLIFACAAGSRSKLAAQLAIALGFREVYNLAGGTQAWRAAGLQLNVPQQQAAG